MIRTLFIIAGAALVLCLAALGGALALGGSDLQRHGWAWTIRDEDGETVRFERIKGDGADDLARPRPSPADGNEDAPGLEERAPRVR